MKVHFSYRLAGPDGRCRLIDHDVVGSLIYCCTTLAMWWDVLVDIGIAGYPRAENMRACLRTTHVAVDGDKAIGVTPIDYCPWCGARFELIPVVNKEADYDV